MLIATSLAISFITTLCELWNAGNDTFFVKSEAKAATVFRIVSDAYRPILHGIQHFGIIVNVKVNSRKISSLSALNHSVYSFSVT
jgi:hypothetical protein